MLAPMKRIGVIGGGAWGTALAALARRNGAEVGLWAREAEVVEAVNHERRNPFFLPGVELEPGIRATGDLAEACRADTVLLAVPAQHMRAVCEALAQALAPGVPAVLCAKGIEQASGRLMSEIAAETLPEAPLAVLSGPTFAVEVAAGLPAAVTLACADRTRAEALRQALGGPAFRPYLSEDVRGAQIGGAVKNVLAIACGIVEGRRLGENARAALITRGMAEMMRLGGAMGARPETLMGLSGMGDLVLTATSASSRNTALGKALGEGEAIESYLDSRRSVAEGVWTAAALVGMAERLGIDMPIAAAVDRIVNHAASIDATIAQIMARPLKDEG